MPIITFIQYLSSPYLAYFPVHPKARTCKTPASPPTIATFSPTSRPAPTPTPIYLATSPCTL